MTQPTDEEMLEIAREHGLIRKDKDPHQGSMKAFSDFASAVLAKWGAPQPAPLSDDTERLREALQRIESASMSMYATRNDMLEHCQDIARAALAKLGAPQQAAQEPFKPDWANYRQGLSDGIAEVLKELYLQNPVAIADGTFNHAPLPLGTPLYASPRPSIPQGYALVPVEATAEMVEAGMDGSPLSEIGAIEVYRAMISAAPATPQQTVVHQYRKQHSADWHDGYADHSDGGGPYEERTLHASPQTAPQQAAPADALVREMLDLLEGIDEHVGHCASIYRKVPCDCGKAETINAARAWLEGNG